MSECASHILTTLELKLDKFSYALPKASHPLLLSPFLSLPPLPRTTPMWTSICVLSALSLVRDCLIHTRKPASVMLVPFLSITAFTPSSSSVTYMVSFICLVMAFLVLNLASSRVCSTYREQRQRYPTYTHKHGYSNDVQHFGAQFTDLSVLVIHQFQQIVSCF